MERTKWIERKFNFDHPEGWIYNILERLRGTPARISKMTDGLSEELLCLKPEGKWSIKEHIGHLSDLEELHEGRIDDFLEMKDTLRAWETTNAQTETANHNGKVLDELIREFVEKRSRFVERFLELHDVLHKRSALHPRLNQAMRPVDLAYFTAEHDDHHLASIRAIMDKQRPA